MSRESFERWKSQIGVNEDLDSFLRPGVLALAERSLRKL
jgi:hypothetical protein